MSVYGVFFFPERGLIFSREDSSNFLDRKIRPCILEQIKGVSEGPSVFQFANFYSVPLCLVLILSLLSFVSDPQDSTSLFLKRITWLHWVGVEAWGFHLLHKETSPSSPIFTSSPYCTCPCVTWPV